MAFNRYAYALNSPLRYSDPSGLCSVGASQFATGAGMPSGANGGLPATCETVDDPDSDGTGWVGNSGTITADAGGEPGSKPFEKDNDGPGTSADSSVQPSGVGTAPLVIPPPPTVLDVMGGFGLGVMRGFLPGATFLPDMPGSDSYEAASQIGELVGSIGAIIGGGALAAGGGLLTATVGGAVVGVPAAAVGASLAAGGVGNLLNTMRKMNATARSEPSSGAPSTRSRIRDAGLPGGGQQSTGPFRYRPPDGYQPGNPLPRGPGGGYLDRFGNEWQRGPYHGDPKRGHTFEWDVQLSPAGRAHWSKYGDGSKGYLNVAPDGRLSH